jgi:uncharacterized damage-inducible protein DinB
MDSIALLKEQIELAHGMVKGTVADLTEEQAHWTPGSKAAPIGANLAHVIVGEDFFLNMVVGRQPLGLGAFAGKTGLSEPPPLGMAWGEWAERVKIDVPVLQEYARAVFRATEEYVAALTPEDLERELDLSNAGLGKMSLGRFVSMMTVVHPSGHCGEISCMKGQQGAKGYAF